MANYNGTPGITQVNRRKSAGKTSKYFGVHWHEKKMYRKAGVYRDGKWRATMRQKGKTKVIGRFDDEKEAAKAYIRAASEYYKTPIRPADLELLNS